MSVYNTFNMVGNELGNIVIIGQSSLWVPTTPISNSWPHPDTTTHEDSCNSYLSFYSCHGNILMSSNGHFLGDVLPFRL